VDFGARSHRQSLARDLSLSSDYELLQQFAPELKMLRLPGTDRHTAATATTSAAAMAPHSGKGGSLRTEIVASFSWSGANPTAPFGVSILNGTAKLTVDCEGADPQAVGGCMVCAAGHPSTAPHTPHNPPNKVRCGPLLPIGRPRPSTSTHSIVDHQIVETIWNNRTAMVTCSDPPSETATSVKLMGITADIKADITTYDLDAANNAGPQP
jgi:hypothetical protein